MLTPAELIKLTCCHIRYGSPIDEHMFFAWLDRISTVVKYEGRGYKLYIYCSPLVPDESLRELIALFYRYNIDMKQLQQFLRPENKCWFYDNTRAYWRERVFGGTPRRKALHSIFGNKSIHKSLSLI